MNSSSTLPRPTTFHAKVDGRWVEYSIFQRNPNHSPTRWVLVVGGSYMGVDSFLSAETRVMMPTHVGIVFINRPGYGGSTPTSMREAIIENARAVLAHAEIARIHCVLAMSSGTQYATELAHALGAERAVVVSPIAPLVSDNRRAILSEMDPKRRQIIELADKHPRVFDLVDFVTSSFLALFPKRGYNTWTNAFGAWDQELLRSEAVRTFLEEDLANTAGGPGFAIELRHWLEWNHLDRFDGPVTVFMGGEDTVSTPSMLEAWIHYKAQLQLIQNCGHYLWLSPLVAYQIWAEAIAPVRKPDS